jgi:NADH-quinone oxidoreductase subunit H
MRAAAQLLSYEIPMGLAILVVVMTAGELRLERIVSAQMSGEQGGCWNVLLHPLACFLLIVTAFAESNRTPFDLAEAEQELVGGYHTEYSSMKFGLFFLAEYAHMLTASALIVVLFFGGWELFPFSWRLNWGWVNWINEGTRWTAALVRCGITFGKVVVFIFIYMWVRWTIPRFRFDQLMRLAWKGLVPMGLALVVLTGLLVYVNRPASPWAPAGNAAMLAVLLLRASRSKSELTGRQSDLPPVPAEGGVVR